MLQINHYHSSTEETISDMPTACCTSSPHHEVLRKVGHGTHKTSLFTSLDPLQFAYRSNRSTKYAIFSARHLSLTQLDKRDTYVRMPFINFSLAFNTIIPQKLIVKLNWLSTLQLDLGFPDREAPVSMDGLQHLQNYHGEH